MKLVQYDDYLMSTVGTEVLVFAGVATLLITHPCVSNRSWVDILSTNMSLILRVMSPLFIAVVHLEPFSY